MSRIIIGRIMISKVFCLLIAVLFLVQLLAFEQVYADSSAVIKSASEPNYPPFCIASPEGKADGFSVELLRAALTAVNLTVAFKIDHWDAIKTELRDGDIRVLPLVGRTPEREEIYDFTFPYLTLHGAIFAKKGDTRINKVSDLADKTVVVMRGDNAEEFARRSNISQHIVAVDSFKQAMELLDAGTYDAVIAQRVMGLQLLNEIKIKNVVPLDIVLNDFRQDLCFAVRAGDKTLLSKLNEGLAIIIANGTFDRIYKKWFAPHIQQQITFKDVWKYVLYIMTPILIATTLLSIALLRREVKRKTTSLVKEIAERKQAGVALQESESRYRSIAETSRDVIYRLDPEGRVTYVSPAVQHTMGYKVNEVDGKSFLVFVHPDDHAVALASYQKLMRGEVVRSLDLRVMKRGGDFIYAELNIVPIVRHNIVCEIQGVIHDITERKQASEVLRRSEEKFKALFEHAMDGFFLLSSTGAIVALNTAFARIHGYTVEEMLKMDLKDLDAPESARLAPERLQRLFNGEPMSFETEHYCKNGQTIPLEVSANLIILGGEKHILGFHRDITERKKAQQERERLVDSLQKALAEIKTLKGILPICSVCKKIRDDKDAWKQMEVFISEHSDAAFSHGYCPDCAKKAYGEIEDWKKKPKV